MDARAATGAAPVALTVIAVGGSQIEPDFHELLSCCLINVGWALFRFGGRPATAAEMGSRPDVRIGDEALAGEADGGDAPVVESRSRRVEVLRVLAEVERLRELIEQTPAPGEVTGLLDGP